MTAQEIIELLRLEPLPVEGGYFRQTYVSADTLPAGTLPRFGRAKSCCTAIYYLLSSGADSFSAMHRLATDEIYHFYLGDAVELLQLAPDGSTERVVLGSDLRAGQRPQYVVPAGAWQGSRVLRGGSFALLGTTMAPGFDPQDFELGRRDELARAYPQAADLIAQLTRI